ncbi:MAG TPA: hypothetical protein VF790_13140 [Dissulfurispiraceae bacterium]
MAKKKQIRGRIILFQEERFRIVDGQGRSFLFDLAHDVPITRDDLTNWMEDKTWLDIFYEGEPGTESAVVHSIRESR